MTYELAVQALATPTRRAILERLRDGPLAVGDVARGLPVSRPAVSQHLKVLKAAGLVRERKVGTRRYYAIDPAGLAPLRTYVESFWQAALAGLKAAAESQVESNESKRRGRR